MVGTALSTWSSISASITTRSRWNWEWSGKCVERSKSTSSIDNSMASSNVSGVWLWSDDTDTVLYVYVNS